MANPWFRMYSEFATDPKVQMLSEIHQRRYIMLLCLRCSNDGVTLHETEVAFQLRISNEEMAETKAVLIERGLIDEALQPVAWDKRQYASDSSAARVAAYRARMKKKAKRPCNVTVTAQDTDTDTEEDKEKPLVPSGDDTSAYSAEFERFWKSYPKREGGNPKKTAWKAWKARIRAGVSADDLIAAASRYADQMRAKGSEGTNFVKQASTFLGPDEHWSEVLRSNVHEFRPRSERPPLREGEFYHPEWEAGIHEVCRDGVHSRETGYPMVFSR